MKTFKLFITLSLCLVLSSCVDKKRYEISSNDDSSISTLQVYQYEDQRSLESFFKYNSEGQLIEYKSFSDSILVGHWIPSYNNLTVEKEFFNNGQIRSVGYKKNGISHGAWHYYNRNGKKTSQRYFENGKKSWNWFVYDQDSFDVQAHDYIRSTGLWIQFFKNGQIKSSSSYIDGQMSGIFKSYFKQNVDKISPKPKEIGTFVDNKKDGLWKYFNEKGFLIREENYFDGTINGRWHTFYDNGNPKIEGQYLQGKRVGLWKWYDLDRKIYLEKDYKLSL